MAGPGWAWAAIIRTYRSARPERISLELLAPAGPVARFARVDCVAQIGPGPVADVLEPVGGRAHELEDYLDDLQLFLSTSARMR